MSNVTNQQSSSGTISTQLTSVRSLISSIEGAGGNQSYSHGGRSYSRVDLPSLYEREERLEIKLMRAKANEANESLMFVRGRPSGCGNS
jgi:hypothetical protein